MSQLLLSPRVELNYQFEGDGDVTFLLFNGNSLSLEFWGSFADKLATRARVIRFDQRNAGQTRFEGSFSLNDVAEDAAALLDALDIEQVVVIGHAWGGRAAQVFVRDHPHRVTRMVICGTGGQHPSRNKPEELQAMFAARRAGDLKAWQQMMEYIFCAPGFSSRDPALFENICQSLLDHPPPRGARWDIRISPSSSYWGTARVPALLIYGKHDRDGTPENAKDLHACLADSKLVVIEDAGHFAIRETENQVLEAVLDFVGL
jgi:3-oxoadipate enol-lactonase